MIYYVCSRPGTWGSGGPIIHVQHDSTAGIWFAWASLFFFNLPSCQGIPCAGCCRRWKVCVRVPSFRYSLFFFFRASIGREHRLHKWYHFPWKLICLRQPSYRIAISARQRQVGLATTHNQGQDTAQTRNLFCRGLLLSRLHVLYILCRCRTFLGTAVSATLFTMGGW